MWKTGDLRNFQGDMKFEWEIKDFLQLSGETNMCYVSPDISFLDASWEIRIFPSGHTSFKSAGWIDLFIRSKSITAPITLAYSFQLKTVNGKADTHAKYRGRFICRKSYDGFVCRFMPRSQLIERKSELLPSGILTVICSLKESGRNCEAGCDTVNRFTQTVEETASTIDISKYNVLQDLKRLYLDQADCDVIIKVKGREFPAHQNILKARSPVLLSTFQTDMKEKVTGVVEVDDCDPSPFSDFLCFLYCGEVENLSVENVFSIFTIADKYDVLDLRSQCLQFIKRNLSVDTFCDTISLALLHSEAELVNFSSHFFTQNIPKIIVTVKWQQFLAENPTVSNELFIKALVPDKSPDA